MFIPVSYRDIFLAKDEGEYICGWHVDDTGFWPATASSPGVNAWIAIDDMPSSLGGGFALAVGSHRVDWNQQAHEAIGSPVTFPDDGFKDAADLFANRMGSGTCNIKTTAPHLHKKLEGMKRIYDIQRGDVIFHTRWLFHRTVPLRRDVVAQDREEMKSRVLRRYSVRYSPGTAVVPPGYGVELSVLSNPANGGRTADDVSRLDGPWYPQCWPSVDEQELSALRSLVENRVPEAEQLRTKRRQEMQPFLASVGQKQHAMDRQRQRSKPQRNKTTKRKPSQTRTMQRNDNAGL